MRKLVASLTIAAIAVMGLFLLLSAGRTSALTPTTPDSPADGEPYVKFEGAVQSRPVSPTVVGDWLIDGVTVTVGLSTTLDEAHGPAMVGAWVEVEGWQQADSSVLAVKIKTQRSPDDEDDEFEFKGIIEELPATPGYSGTWQVSGIRFTVNPSTTIKGTPAISKVAEVKALRAADGTLTAKEIEVKDSDDDENEREWKGFIEGLGDGPAPRYEGEWGVGGISVTVNASTELKYTGSFTLGDRVEVEAYEQPDGSLVADEIEIEHRDDHDAGRDDDVKFYGVIQHITPFSGTWPITWEIGHLTVWLTGTTIVDESKGPAVVGAWAEVEADDVSGQLWARKIEIEQVGEGDDDEAEIKGLVTSLDPLIIAGQEIVIDTDTVIRGTPALSVTAEAKGRWVPTPTLHFLASRVEFKDGDDHDDGSKYEIEGTIVSLPPGPSFNGTWGVTTAWGITRSFEVTTSTEREFEGDNPALGCWVEAKTTLQGGVEVATEVELEHCGPGDDDGHPDDGEYGDDSAIQPALGVAASQPGTDAVNVSRTSGHSRVPDLVVRANGDHHLVWEESDGRIYHSWKVAGGLWSLPMPVSTGSRADLKEAAGVLYLIWADDDGTGNYEIYLAQWDDDSESWGAPKNVSRTSGQSISPGISADGGGNLHFAWADDTPGYWVIYHGTLNANAPVPSARGQAPQIAVAGDGTVHLTWQDSDLSGVLQIYYSRLDGADWSPPQDISHSGLASTVPNITLDGDSAPHLVWEEMQASGDKDIYHAGWSGGGWSSPMALSNTAADSFLPEISLGGGALHVAWTEAATVSTNPRLLYCKLSGESCSALQTVLSNGTGLSEVYLDADASGKVHIAWANYTSSGLVNPTWDWDIYYGAGHLMTNQTYLPLAVR